MVEAEGYIERIVYKNEDNGYSVLTMTEGTKELCLTGFFPDIEQGEYLHVKGEMVKHPMYGNQMQVKEYMFSAPSDSVSIERYLGSGAIKGIGAALAGRIVAVFGEESFRIMEEEPERLEEVKGISARKAMEIADQVNEKRDARRAMLFLQQYGITLNLSAKIYQNYGQQLYSIIRENPYRLADDIEGVGFKMADEIARKSGIAVDSDFRIRSGILYALQQAGGMGHTYLPMEELKSWTMQLLAAQTDQFEKYIMDLVIDKKIVVKDQEVYDMRLYYMELNAAKMLCDLNIREEIPLEAIDERLKQIEKTIDWELDEVQRTAILEAARNGVTIVTGGPGTGKTTVINSMIQYFSSQGLDILLAAPTGRAAKRMSEATGYEAQTIHRMLEVTGSPKESETSFFVRDQDNPLETDIVIVDEMSMVDINLMHALLKAMVPGMKLILVGDTDQLPSVGPGNVLKDLISANCFSTVKLTKIFRQASQSDIIQNAHKINEGKAVLLKKTSKDFLFIHRDNPGNITGAVITLVKDKLPNYVNADQKDIQVLTPMRKGVLGVEQLNKELQQYLNPPSGSKKEKQIGTVLLREGDKVMQIKNNYQIEWEVSGAYHTVQEKGMGVFNGDMGTIKELNFFTEEFVVEFDEGRLVRYSFKQADELELAYAITVHKAQGAEYPAVVLPLLSGPRMLMNRNILYTAVTRAKNCVCIVGSQKTFDEMIKNQREQKRCSGLCRRIKEMEEV